MLTCLISKKYVIINNNNHIYTLMTFSQKSNKREKVHRVRWTFFTELFKIVLQYDGTRYQGWQRQVSTDNTIQGKIEVLLSKMCEAPVEIQGAGRTDAGVHAKGMVANAHIDTELSLQEIQDYMNHYLPEDILVLSVVEAGERFHSRLNAK